MSTIAEIMRLFARVGADTSEFTTKMAQVSATGKTVGKGLGTDLGGGANEAQQALQQLTSGGLGGLLSMATQVVPQVALAVAALKTLKGAVEAGIEMQDTAQQANITADAFERIAGVDLGDGAAELREATKGAASDMQAASMAMQLMSMHLADNTADAAELLNIATQLARLKNPGGGGDISGLLPMLTNQSALRLDEYLVSGDRTQKLQDLYEAAGMESGEAFMRAFMEEAKRTLAAVGPVVPTMAEQEAATGENLQTARARSFEGSMLSAALGEVRDVIKDDKQMLADYFNQVAEGRQIVDDYYAEIQKYRDQGLISDEAFASMKSGMQVWAQAAALGIVNTEDLRVQLELVVNTAGNLDEARTASVMRDDLSNATAEAEHLELVLGRIASGDYDTTVTVSWNDQWQGGPAARAYRARMMGQGGELGTPGLLPREDDRGNWLNEDTLAAHQQMQSYGGALQDWLHPTALAGGSGGGADNSAAERQAAEFESFVSGLLQPTQVTDADMAATETGQYQDKWDEYMRRFRMQGEGQPNRNAYEIGQEEKAFYGGQRMGEVNWEGLIGAGREQQQYEQGQQNLLQTAMAKLAEAGIGMNREQVANLLGVPQDYESVGAERSVDFAQGIANAGMGGAVTTAFETQLKAESDRWIAAGEDMAALFVEGFQTGTAGDLLQALIDAILPEVLEVVNA